MNRALALLSQRAAATGAPSFEVDDDALEKMDSRGRWSCLPVVPCIIITAMGLPGNILQFREAYWAYKNDTLDVTEAELRRAFGRWNSHHYWRKYRAEGYVPGVTIPSPIQRVDYRVKRLESVEDKIRRRYPDQFTGGWVPASFEEMDDALGARIVVYFLSDLTLIHRELHDLEDQRLIEIRREPPVRAYLPPGLPERLDLHDVDRQEKESGYASVHYYCRLIRSVVDDRRRPWFEVQVRTLAEHVWAEVHHLIGYKREKDTQVEVEEETRIISAQLKAIDEHFDLLRMRLGRAQERIKRPRLADRVNAENLPHILAELNLLADQREIDGLLRSLASRGIRNVKEFRARATRDRVSLIQQEWRRVTRRDARTFDVIGVVGTIDAGASGADVKRRTQEWARVANRWGKRRDSDVERLLRALVDFDVPETKRLRSVASSHCVEVIEHAWNEVTGERPSATEVLAVLATLKRASEDDTVAERSRSMAKLVEAG